MNADPKPNKVASKVEKSVRKCKKKAEAKRDGVTNPQNYNFYQI